MTTAASLRYNVSVNTLISAPALLLELLAQDSPAGDEGPLADWLEVWLAREVPGARTERLGDALLAVRGDRPAMSVFAHTDTTGWTQGYDTLLVRIGGPDGKAGDGIRPAHEADAGHTLAPRKGEEHGWRIKGNVETPPGTRWVYAATPEVKNGQLRSPYLDNRGGLWAALLALKACPNIAVALTTGEEVGGPGAVVCARRLSDAYGIQQALISDLTWHTKHIKRGRGPAVSLRDSSVPRQRYLERVLTLAEASGLPWQREVESSGGSDGASIDRAGVPMDWVFVGAPEKDPHTACERAHLGDLDNMAALLTFLVNGLSEGE